jgi:hypothetical protein
MPENVQDKRSLRPSRGYDIQLFIKDKDYSADLVKVKIISSLLTAYQTVTLDLFLDPNDIILDKLFGKDPIKLRVTLLSDVVQGTLEQIDMDLMYLSSTSNFAPKTQLSEGRASQTERGLLSIVAVCRKPYKTMTTMVSDIYFEKKIKDIFQDLVSKNTDAQLIYDDNKSNSEQIDQVLIRPMTLYKCIEYLDNTFGLFDGASNLGFCTYDNKIQIYNLSERMNKDQTFTIYVLATDKKESDVFEKSQDGKNFYTYDAVDNSYNANTKVAYMARDIKYVVNPKDTLYHIVEHKLDELSKTAGAVYQSRRDNQLSLNLDENVTRTQVNSDHIGYEKSTTWATSRDARQLISLANVSINIERNLRILNLMNVGEPVKVITKTLEYVDLSGKYILKSSDIDFSRRKDWETTVRLNLMRTNKTI